MASPFPGVDPYVESPAFWKDFHGRFINSLSEVIFDTLPDNYVAMIEEDVLLLEPALPRGRQVTPGVLVAQDPFRSSAGVAGPAVSTAEPVTLANVEFLDLPTQHYIQILRLPDREVVTVLEVLSPTNKGSDGRGAYLDKRQRLLRRSVNVVEIDLLRAGRRVALSGSFPPGHYFALVSRTARRPACDVYGWTVRQPCPKVPIPLLPPDGDAVADLGRAFAMAYDCGRYGRLIRYVEPPPPPAFSPDDTEWGVTTARSAAAH
jgi:hypothetical protein